MGYGALGVESRNSNYLIYFNNYRYINATAANKFKFEFRLLANYQLPVPNAQSPIPYSLFLIKK